MAVDPDARTRPPDLAPTPVIVEMGATGPQGHKGDRSPEFLDSTTPSLEDGGGAPAGGLRSEEPEDDMTPTKDGDDATADDLGRIMGDWVT